MCFLEERVGGDWEMSGKLITSACTFTSQTLMSSTGKTSMELTQQEPESAALVTLGCVVTWLPQKHFIFLRTNPTGPSKAHGLPGPAKSDSPK